MHKIIGEVKPLFQMGFAVHLLKPKSKMPLENEWTKSPRSSLERLDVLYRPGMNVGVRLGRVSKIADRGFLAVVDCDVKSSHKKHRDEMVAKFKELFPTLSGAPQVESGRGNGSRHVYCLTKEEVSGKTLARSTDRVEVLMPSVKASEADKRALGQEKIDKGLRLRPAWEISFMSKGRQVVLPPSAHPDTGSSYVWARALTKTEDLVLVDQPRVEESANIPTAAGFSFEPEEVDISRLSTKTRGMLIDGIGVEDRSAAVLSVAIAMFRENYSDNEVLSALTNRAYYLSSAALDRGGGSPNSAAYWLYRYTLPKAKAATDHSGLFEETHAPAAKLSEAEAEAQLRDLPWQGKLDKSLNGTIKNTIKNVELILVNAVSPKLFVYDEFAIRYVQPIIAPWDEEKHFTVNQQVNDATILLMRSWMGKVYGGFEPSEERAWDAVGAIALSNRVHPVREYIKSLSWDGVPRISFWLRDYCQATKDDPLYVEAVSRKVLCGMVARAHEPGVKFDHVLILEGRQGLRKSSTIEALAGALWFTDQEIDVRNKDGIMAIQGKWVMELGELASIRNQDIEPVKAFITRKTDRMRAPYGKSVNDYPRQMIFIGSTNQRAYLKDQTGNRRFWPVAIGECDPDGMAKVRDQLIAEAKFTWDMGEELYLKKEIEDLAYSAQSTRTAEDDDLLVATEIIEDLFAQQELLPPKERQIDPVAGFKQSELLTFLNTNRRLVERKKVPAALKILGFDNSPTRIKGSRAPLRLWRKVKKRPVIDLEGVDV